MSSRFYYEDLNCHALQQAIKAHGEFDVVLFEQKAVAFDKVVRSLFHGQKIEQNPLASLDNQKELGAIFVQLVLSLRIAWKSMFSFHRFSEFKIFWHLEKPLSVSSSTKNDGSTVFKVRCLTKRSSRSFHSLGRG